MVIANTELTPAEHERIRAAITAAEQRGGARFALVVVPASDRYALFPALWAAVLALSVMGLVALLRPGLGIRTGFMINGGLFIVLFPLLDWLPLRLRTVPERIKHNHARQLAHREFADRLIGASEHRNGVLFFVSLGEHYAEIIADREVHSRVAPDMWDKLVADFVTAVKANHLVEGFAAAVQACAGLLETHSPNGGLD